MLTLLGPTASGKTQVAAAVSRLIGAEIISADSRQVYRRMDIGTGKDLADYTIDGKTVPYHLIDICEPGEKYNVFRYKQDFETCYNAIRERGHKVVLCGGTGLYIESILRDYDISPVPQNPTLRKALKGLSLPELASKLSALKAQNNSTMHNVTDIDTIPRAIRAIEIEEAIRSSRAEGLEAPAKMRQRHDVVVGLDLPRELRRERITRRLHQRLQEGMVEEVRRLIDSGVAPDDLIYYGLEYKFITLHLIGRLSYDEMVTQLEIAIHQFAKRQMTWFRGMERRGISIQWVDATLPLEEKARLVASYAQDIG